MCPIANASKSKQASSVAMTEQKRTNYYNKTTRNKMNKKERKKENESNTC